MSTTISYSTHLTRALSWGGGWGNSFVTYLPFLNTPGAPENPILRTCCALCARKKKKKYRNTLYCVLVAYLVRSCCVLGIFNFLEYQLLLFFAFYVFVVSTITYRGRICTQCRPKALYLIGMDGGFFFFFQFVQISTFFSFLFFFESMCCI